jgi:hypothetical protein
MQAPGSATWERNLGAQASCLQVSAKGDFHFPKRLSLREQAGCLRSQGCSHGAPPGSLT